MKKYISSIAFLFIVLNTFAQTFQKAIYKHANEVYAGQGISNGKLFSDSVGTSKWHHSVSIEGQLHDNYVYQSSMAVYNLFINNIGGDTINASKLQPRFIIAFTSQKRNLFFLNGIAYNKQKFIYTFPNNPIVEYKFLHFDYHILEVPIGFGFIKRFPKWKINYYLSINPEIILTKVGNYSNSIRGDNIGKQYSELNAFSLTSSLGLSWSYIFSKKFELYINFLGRSSLFPVKYVIDHNEFWINYSSLNIGFGLKYNFN